MDETNDPLAEVEELVSALVDDQATDDQIRRLTDLLLTDSEARGLYLTCMRMHSDLDYLGGGGPSEQPRDITGVRESRNSSESKTLPPEVDPTPDVSDARPAKEFTS